MGDYDNVDPPWASTAMPTASHPRSLNRDGSLTVGGIFASGHLARVGTVTKRNGSARRSSGSLLHFKRRRGSRNAGRRQLGEESERTEVRRLADEGWVEWGGELIWAVGFTLGGAPYGLRVSDFDPADLQAMGLQIAAADDAGLGTAESSIHESDDSLRDGDCPFRVGTSTKGARDRACEGLSPASPTRP